MFVTRSLALALCFLALAKAATDQLPKLTTKTLSGSDISLPGDPKIAAYVLAFGFSHKCEKAMAAWDKRIAPAYANDPLVGYYEMPELQGVPGFVKGMILHGMRRAIQKPEQSRFAPVFEGESVLKEIVGYKQPEVAYLVVAGSDGKVVWTSHGAASDADFAALQKAVAAFFK